MPKMCLRRILIGDRGANSATPDLAGFKGRTSKGRGGHQGSTAEGGRERKGEGKGEEKGHTGTSFSPI